MEEITNTGALRLKMDLWHPNCWIIQTTEQYDVGILGHLVYSRKGGKATSHVTIYGQQQETIEDAIGWISEFESVYHVSEMISGYHHRSSATPPGNASREILVEHDGRKQVTEQFISRGFVHDERTNVYDGIERWVVLTNHDREEIQSYLNEIRDEMDAEITVRSIAPAARSPSGELEPLPLDELTNRQREVFQLARERGHYSWPSKAKPGELAAELNISKSTFNEHLYKAEEKLLDIS